MPNWVYNTVSIHGAPNDVEAFLDKAGKPRPYSSDDGVVFLEGREFSFWNFVAPPEDKWELYFGISGVVDGERIGDPEWNWYPWNSDNWGCKWDAGNIEVEYDGESFATVRFDTPWDTPRKIIAAIAEQHKELSISWHYEEEQGWGGDVEIDNGEVSVVEWDIPDSHAEYEQRGNECPCGWMGDDFRFEDCPVKEEVK